MAMENGNVKNITDADVEQYKRQSLMELINDNSFSERWDGTCSLGAEACFVTPGEFSRYVNFLFSDDKNLFVFANAIENYYKGSGNGPDNYLPICVLFASRAINVSAKRECYKYKLNEIPHDFGKGLDTDVLRHLKFLRESRTDCRTVHFVTCQGNNGEEMECIYYAKLDKGEWTEETIGFAQISKFEPYICKIISDYLKRTRVGDAKKGEAAICVDEDKTNFKYPDEIQDLYECLKGKDVPFIKYDDEHAVAIAGEKVRKKRDECLKKFEAANKEFKPHLLYNLSYDLTQFSPYTKFLGQFIGVDGSGVEKYFVGTREDAVPKFFSVLHLLGICKFFVDNGYENKLQGKDKKVIFEFLSQGHSSEEVFKFIKENFKKDNDALRNLLQELLRVMSKKIDLLDYKVGYREEETLFIDETVTELDRSYGDCKYIFITPKCKKDKLDDYAFYNFTKLESIFFGRKISDFGKGVFNGCNNLKKIYIVNENQFEKLKVALCFSDLNFDNERQIDIITESGKVVHIKSYDDLLNLTKDAFKEERQSKIDYLNMKIDLTFQAELKKEEPIKELDALKKEKYKLKCSAFVYAPKYNLKRDEQEKKFNEEKQAALNESDAKINSAINDLPDRFKWMMNFGVDHEDRLNKVCDDIGKEIREINAIIESNKPKKSKSKSDPKRKKASNKKTVASDPATNKLKERKKNLMGSLNELKKLQMQLDKLKKEQERAKETDAVPQNDVVQDQESKKSDEKREDQSTQDKADEIVKESILQSNDEGNEENDFQAKVVKQEINDVEQKSVSEEKNSEDENKDDKKEDSTKSNGAVNEGRNLENEVESKEEIKPKSSDEKNITKEKVEAENKGVENDKEKKQIESDNKTGNENLEHNQTNEIKTDENEEENIGDAERNSDDDEKKENKEEELVVVEDKETDGKKEDEINRLSDQIDEDTKEDNATDSQTKELKSDDKYEEMNAENRSKSQLEENQQNNLSVKISQATADTFPEIWQYAKNHNIKADKELIDKLASFTYDDENNKINTGSVKNIIDRIDEQNRPKHQTVYIGILASKNKIQEQKNGYLKCVAEGGLYPFLISSEESCARAIAPLINKLSKYLYGEYANDLSWFGKRGLRSKVLAGLPGQIRNYVALKLNENTAELTYSNIMSDSAFTNAYNNFQESRQQQNETQQGHSI